MAPIKLSIAFALAAATIAPILAQPLGEAHEITGNVDHLPSHLHHERIPVQSLLEGDNKLGHKHKTHSRHGKALEKHKSLLHKDHIPAKENKILGLEGKALGQLDEAHSKPEIVAREYIESDEMFERAESGNPGRGPLPSRLGFGMGPVLSRLRGLHGFTSTGRPRLPFFGGHGPVVNRPFNGATKRNFRFGLATAHRRGPAMRRLTAREYADSDDMLERDFEEVEFDVAREYVDSDDMLERDFEEVEFDVAREFTDSDDMVERDFEDLELDARDFDDSELYLD
jgi:hypothetical protein